jgi:hypothetical protein
MRHEKKLEHFVLVLKIKSCMSNVHDSHLIPELILYENKKKKKKKFNQIETRLFYFILNKFKYRRLMRII